MKTPTANELLRAAAEKIGVDIETEDADADQWRKIAVTLAEGIVAWLAHLDAHNADALNVNAFVAVSEAKRRQTQKRIGSMESQKQRSRFIEWARVAIEGGMKPANVHELQALPGFDPKWSRQSDETLKKWTHEAGLRFRAGRPQKKN